MSLRLGPDRRQPIAAFLGPGEEVTVFGEEGGWLRVRYEGIVGWVPESD